MIPLTIKHEKEDIPFFTMPQSSLLLLLNIEYKKALGKEYEIVDRWIENKKCACITENIINKKISLDCKHLNKVIDNNKIVSTSRAKIERMSSALIFRNLDKVRKRLK